MKKVFALVPLTALALLAFSCRQPILQPVPITIQLTNGGQAFTQEGVSVLLSDESGSISFQLLTDSEGKVSATLPVGFYTVSATWKQTDEGERITYNGSLTGLIASPEKDPFYCLDMQAVKSQLLIIKELYTGGCLNEATGKSYSDDAYIVLYNNSETELDASDVVFCFAAPYNSTASNKYYDIEGKLLYESLPWIPALGAIWWFTAPVTIPAYSQIVVAVFGAIDHTITVPTSVNLSNPNYYWMSNDGITAYDMPKYHVSDAIPSSHYLTCVPYTQGRAWALSNSSPAFYIARMPQSQAKALSENVDDYDHTLGAGAPNYVVKMPKANVIGAVEVWPAASIKSSKARFSADINTGYIAHTNSKGYSIYRNVDKEATEALEENKGKLVYNYAGGTEDVEGSTDPSGIDAEASIKAGAHIIYSQTNDSSKDFHQRKVASIKDK